MGLPRSARHILDQAALSASAPSVRGASSWLRQAQLARTNSSGRAVYDSLACFSFCILSKCLPCSRKWSQHLAGLQRHLGSGAQLCTFVQMEVAFHLFQPYLQ